MSVTISQALWSIDSPPSINRVRLRVSTGIRDEIRGLHRPLPGRFHMQIRFVNLDRAADPVWVAAIWVCGYPFRPGAVVDFVDDCTAVFALHRLSPLTTTVPSMRMMNQA